MKDFSKIRLRRALLITPIAVVAVGSIAFFSFENLEAQNGDSAHVVRLDALSDLIRRSPGERGITDILKGRIAPKGLWFNFDDIGHGEPPARVLGKVFDIPPEDFVARATDTPESSLGVSEPAPVSDLTSLANLPPTSGNVGPGFPSTGAIATPPGVIGGGPSAGAPGGGNGGGADSGDTPAVTPPAPTPPAPIVTNAVPEPASWILMIIGFLACGSVMRRRKAGDVDSPAPQAPCAGF